MKSIQVIAPVYNESECIEEFVLRVFEVFSKLENYDCSLLLVENGSTDNSLEKIYRLALDIPNLEYIVLSRNFGMDGGIMAGLANTSADFAIIMASDLQDDPKYIPIFINEIEKGYENVYGIVKKRQGTGLIRKINSQLFYLFASKLTGNLFPRNASDFRIISRKVYLELNKINDSNFVLRSSIAWLGFKSTGVPIIRPPRVGGSSKANTLRVLTIAIRAILSNSYSLLRLASIIGLTLSGLSLISLIVTTILFFTKGVPFPGFGTITSLIILLFGIMFLLIGILSEYTALIYEEVKNRPRYIISEHNKHRKN